MYFVYVLKNSENRKLYYGYTNDLQRRLSEHKENGAWELVYYEAYKSEFDARKRERNLKEYGQALSAPKRRLMESLN